MNITILLFTYYRKMLLLRIVKMFYSNPRTFDPRQKFHNHPFGGHHKFAGINTSIFLADVSWILSPIFPFYSFPRCTLLRVFFFFFFLSFFSHPGTLHSPCSHLIHIPALNSVSLFLSFVSSTPSLNSFVPLGCSFALFIFSLLCISFFALYFSLSLSLFLFNSTDLVEFAATGLFVFVSILSRRILSVFFTFLFLSCFSDARYLQLTLS